MATADKALRLINDNKIMVFSKSYCPFCHKAKRALDSVTKDYTVLELDNMGSEGDDMQDALREITGGRTVPRVFIGGEFLGGGDETAQAAQDGSLKQKVQAVAA